MNKNDLNKVEEGYYGNKEDYYDKQGHCYTSFFISDIIIDNNKNLPQKMVDKIMSYSKINIKMDYV